MTGWWLLLGLWAFQDGQTLREQTRVDFVTLDVVVTRKGALVTDLPREAFTVTENGQPVTVTYFDVLDFRRPAEGGAGDRPLQQVILALDFESVIHTDVPTAFRNVRRFLKDLDPAYRYSINLYALDRGSLTRGFTEETAEVEAALNRYEDRFQSNRYQAGAWDSDNPLLGGGGGGGGRLRVGASPLEQVNDILTLIDALNICASLPSRCSCIQTSIDEFVVEQGLRTDRVIGELEALTFKFKENADLKTMILVSPGFARANLSSVDRLARDGAAGCALSGFGNGRLRVDADLRRVAHACIQNRVVFHTFDVFNRAGSRRRVGAAHGDVVSAFARDMAEGLKDLAHASGGSFKQAYRLKGAADQVLAENRYFYILGYAGPPGEPGYRDIEVKVAGKRLKVRHRRGYFAGE